jgi:hypothetical protein
VVVEVGGEAVGPAGRVAVGDEVIAYRIDGFRRLCWRMPRQAGSG